MKTPFAFLLALFFSLYSILPTLLPGQIYQEIQTTNTTDSTLLVPSYGISTALIGNQALIGSYQESKDENGEELEHAGAVYVLQQDPAKYWQPFQLLTPQNREHGDLFGYALSVDQNYAAINLRGSVPAQGQRGVAMIFKRQANGRWQETAELFANNVPPTLNISPSVHLSGRMAIVGYPYWNFPLGGGQSISSNGIAFLFERDSLGESWTEVSQLIVPDSTDDNHGGWSVAVWEEYAFMGAPYEDEDSVGGNTIFNAGAVYVFQKDSAQQWRLHQKLIPPNRRYSGWFGYSMDIHDSTLIVGAKGQNNNKGSVYVYQKDSSGLWRQSQELVAQDATPGDGFGYHVSAGENKLIIGAPGDDHTMGPNQGSVYVFEQQPSGQWTQVQKIYESQAGANRQFGIIGLAIDGNSAVMVKQGGGTYHFEVCASNHELIKVQACEPMEYYGHWLDSTGLYENLALEVDWNCDSLSADVQFDLIEVDTAVVRQGDSLVAMAVGAEFQWIRCGQGWPELPGETDSVFVPDTLGFYAVLVDQSGCQERSGCFFWAPPLVSHDAPLTSRLRLYPNPGAGQATLDLSAMTQPADLRIYDARGRWLGSLERLRGSVEVDLRQFGSGPGLYLIQVQAGGEIGTLKMVWE